MTIFFAVLGVVLLLSVWALYIRIGLLYENWTHEANAQRDFLKEEFAVIWTAFSSNRDRRAEQLNRFGLGALHVFDRRIAKGIPEGEQRYQHLAEELKRHKTRWWDYSDIADREQKTKRERELEIEVKMASAQATPEEEAVWEKKQDRLLDEMFKPPAKE